MVISSSVLNGLRRSFHTLSMEAIAAAQPRWSAVAMLVPSSNKYNDYGWLEALPGMREWLGDRVIKNLKEKSYTITNVSYEATIGVDRDDIEDDNLGIYSPMFRSFGESVAYSPDEIVFKLLVTET